MNMKKRIAVVLFLLITCIATMCFATSVDTNNSVTNVVEEVTEDNTTDSENVTENIVEDEVVSNNTAGNLTIEPRTGDMNETEEETAESETDVTTSSNTVNDNVYKATTESTYTLEDTVYGNVFMVGNEIIIDSDYISGDLYIVANNITINENTVIDGNVYMVGQSINIEGSLYRSVYMVGKTINLGENSVIEYDTFLAGELIKINGELSRSAYVYAGKLEVSDTASVGRNLSYEANEKADIPDGVVSGRVDFQKIVTEEKSTTEIILEYAIDLLKNLIFTLTVFIIISLISTKFTHKAQEYMGKHVLKSIGIGLFALIVMPLAAAFLIVISSTSMIGVTLIPVYILLLLIANAITAIAFSAMLCNRSKGMKLPIVLVLISIALWALESIPYIGTIVAFFSILIGVGILLQVIFDKNKTISKSQEDVSKENKNN